MANGCAAQHWGQVLTFEGKTCSLRRAFTNWQWWEIEKSKEEEKKLIGAKIERSNESPEPLLNAGATWASYTVESILKALREA